VSIDSMVQPEAGSKLNIGSVHVAPAARTAWHYVTEVADESNHVASPSLSTTPG
jgi:hypothetical protein